MGRRLGLGDARQREQRRDENYALEGRKFHHFAGGHCFCVVKSPSVSEGSTMIDPLMEVAAESGVPV